MFREMTKNYRMYYYCTDFRRCEVRDDGLPCIGPRVWHWRMDCNVKIKRVTKAVLAEVILIESLQGGSE